MMNFKENKLVLASKNKGKIEEMKKLLEPYDLTILSCLDFDIPDVEENGHSFAENAMLKAMAVSKATNLSALADDSGLEIDELGGIPGIYSARFAVDGDFNKAMYTLYNMVKESGNLKANFKCELAFVRVGEKLEKSFFTGEVYGTLTWPPVGESGFGYDPFFIPNGYDKTFGQLGKEVKNEISHRAMAVKKFIDICVK